MFDFGLEEGDERSALFEPWTVVLSRRNALKYFGTEDVIGRSLSIEWDQVPVDFKVTGLLKPVPDHSHIHFDMLMSIASFPDERFSNWRSNYLYTYVLLREGTSRPQVEEKFRSFVITSAISFPDFPPPSKSGTAMTIFLNLSFVISRYKSTACSEPANEMTKPAAINPFIRFFILHVSITRLLFLKCNMNSHPVPFKRFRKMRERTCFHYSFPAGRIKNRIA